MWSRLDDVSNPAGVRELLAVIGGAGDLDLDRARAWTVVRAVDYWLWGLDAGLTVDPIRCHRLLHALA